MNFIKSFWKAILWGMLIFLLSGLSGDTMKEIPLITIKNIDKVGHFTFYFIFTFLILNGYVNFSSSEKPVFKAYILTILLVMMYGGMLEIMQHYIFIHRTADWFDFAANTFGGLTAILLYNLVTKLLIKLHLAFILK
jgi:VanZ family protein